MWIGPASDSPNTSDVSCSTGMQLVDMLTTVMKLIVDYPDAVEVSVSENSGCVRLYVRLDARDRRSIEGRHAEESLNVLLAAAGGKLNKRVFLELR